MDGQAGWQDFGCSCPHHHDWCPGQRVWSKAKEEIVAAKDRFNKYATKKFMLANLIIALGGRAAEVFLYNNKSSNNKFNSLRDTLNYLYENRKIPSMIDLRYKDGVALDYGK